MIHKEHNTHPYHTRNVRGTARSHHKLPPGCSDGSAAPAAPDGAEERVSVEAAAGSDERPASGIGPGVGRAGVADDGALVEDATIADLSGISVTST